MRLTLCIAVMVLLTACGKPGSYSPGGTPKPAEQADPSDGGVGGTGAPPQRHDEEDKDGGCGGTGCSSGGAL